MPAAARCRHVAYLSLHSAAVSADEHAAMTPSSANFDRAAPNNSTSSSMVGTARRMDSASQIFSSSWRYSGSCASGTRYARSATCTAGDSGLTSVTTTRPGTPSEESACLKACTSGTRRDAAVISTFTPLTVGLHPGRPSRTGHQPSHRVEAWLRRARASGKARPGSRAAAR